VAPGVATVDLRALGLAPGAAARMRLTGPPVELRLGGQDYRTDPACPELDLEVTRGLSGLALRLRTTVDLVGSCNRCMEPARVSLEVDSSEYVADERSGDAAVDEDLDSAYVDHDQLDLALWARDSIAEVVPVIVFCREDCAGLCPTCGANRNLAPCDCVVEVVDSRWDALRELAERMSKEPGAG
jgi:DUF177 domain-containing protein